MDRPSNRVMTEKQSEQVSSTNSLSRRTFLVGAGSTGAAALAGCLGSGGGGGGEDGLSGSVNIAGSSTVYPISTALAEEFQKKHSGVQVSVSSTGTGGGFSNFFCVGKTDINDASREIQQSEVQKCKKNDVTPLEYQIATDALTIVVSKEADWIDCISFEELRKIWGPGDAPQKWSDVNPEWPDEEMNLYGAASTSGTFDFFTETVMGEEGKHRSDYQGTEKDNTIVNAVSKDKYAMGYFGFAYYTENQDKLKGVKVTDKSGDAKCVPPTVETAKSGKYPLSRPLFIYVKKEALSGEAVRKFTRYYLKQSKTDLVKQVGYVPVTDSKAKENLADLESAIKDAS